MGIHIEKIQDENELHKQLK